MADPPIQLVYRPTTLRRFQIAKDDETLVITSPLAHGTGSYDRWLATTVVAGGIPALCTLTITVVMLLTGNARESVPGLIVLGLLGAIIALSAIQLYQRARRADIAVTIVVRPDSITISDPTRRIVTRTWHADDVAGISSVGRERDLAGRPTGDLQIDLIGTPPRTVLRHLDELELAEIRERICHKRAADRKKQATIT
jgi:hypothetical protein